jgi:hypothetical protein
VRSPARPRLRRSDTEPADVGVFGQLSYEDEESGEDVPAVGVAIEVDGVGWPSPTRTASSAIVRARPGDYVVTLDVETLPEGVNLRNPDANPLEATVNQSRDRRVLFPLVFGEAEESTTGAITFRRVAQLTAEGLKQGLYLAMAAIGLTLIFGTTGLVNFAQAELVTFGMLSTYFFNFYGLAGVIGFLAPLPPPFGGGVNLVFAAVLGILSGAVARLGAEPVHLPRGPPRRCQPDRPDGDDDRSVDRAALRVRVHLPRCAAELR